MTITADTAVKFPACPTFGFTSEPNYLVKIVAREGGFERRQRVWSRPLHKYTAVPTGDRPQRDIEQILYFWHAVGGMSQGFRFKDWVDFKSCVLDDEPSATDQPFALTDDSPSGFQLVKQYTFGPLTQERDITRPIGDTITVANEVGTVADPSTWTLDEATGILTPHGDFPGTPHSWGGEFDVWCRFDAQFNPVISSYLIQQVTVQLAELRE